MDIAVLATQRGLAKPSARRCLIHNRYAGRGGIKAQDTTDPECRFSTASLAISNQRAVCSKNVTSVLLSERNAFAVLKFNNIQNGYKPSNHVRTRMASPRLRFYSGERSAEMARPLSFFHVEGAGCSLPATQFPLAFVGLPRQTAPATTAPCRTAGVVDFIEVCAAAHVTSDLSCETGQSSRCLTRRNNRSINSSRNGGELLGGLHHSLHRGLLSGSSMEGVYQL